MSAEIVLGLRILAAAALYAFLGWGLSTLWRDLRSQAAQSSERKIPAIRLALDHSDLDQIRQFTAKEITLGRDPTSDFVIKNDTVSARHARLSYHHRQWWLEDLNSTNGTFLNEEPLYTATVIVSGDEIRCGQVDILVSIDDKNSQEFPVR
ncbi:MAG TPA: FHA domain-containing protein [Anaerolineaceae bacterium]|nr:FHA domain-containing protein [Anaerolineaceae bacterium]